MGKKTHKINVKQFLADLRSGKSDDELMEIHDLSPKALEKLIMTLIEKKMLDPAELSAEPISAEMPTFRDSAPVGGAPDVQPEPGRPVRKPPREFDPDHCPYCGVRVAETALTCPECGHVLPGEDRWAKAEQDIPLMERIPPLVLGSLFAIPIGIALFIFFAFFMLPAQEAKVQDRIERLRKQTPDGQSPKGAAKQLARDVAARNLRMQIGRLQSLDIFAEVNDDFSVFYAGSRWNSLSEAEREEHLVQIQHAKKRSDMFVPFVVMDMWDNTVAQVTETKVEIIPIDDARSWSTVEDPEPIEADPSVGMRPQPGDFEGLERSIERRLPTGRGHNLPGY